MTEDSNSSLFDFSSRVLTPPLNLQEVGQIKLWLYQNGVLDIINPIALYYSVESGKYISGLLGEQTKKREKGKELGEMSPVRHSRTVFHPNLFIKKNWLVVDPHYIWIVFISLYRILK